MAARRKKKVQSTEQLHHVLIPKHEKLDEKQKAALMEQYNITLAELPKIFLEDPAIRHLGCVEGDVVKITRESQTAGAAEYYRGVING